MWVKRDGFATFNSLTDPTEVLINHDTVMKASFLLTDNNNMKLEGRASGKSGTFRFPHNRWMFIQIASNST